jgi:putative flavoprotein involved in K+ transport
VRPAGDAIRVLRALMAPFVRLGGGHCSGIVARTSRGAGVIWSETRTAGVRDGKPLLNDGQVLDVASVVWCTGYRPDYGWIELPVLDADGWPVMDRGAAVAAPGLYVQGGPLISTNTSMLVLGASREAEMVVKQVAARTGRPALKAAAAG